MLGATLARSTDTALTGVLVTVLVGLVFALLGTHAWLRLVRRSPELRAALQLGPDGAPIVAEPPPEPRPGPMQGDGPG
jgi:hypothetical protein